MNAEKFQKQIDDFEFKLIHLEDISHGKIGELATELRGEFSKLERLSQEYAESLARERAVKEKLYAIESIKKIIHEMDWGVMDNDIDAPELLRRIDTFLSDKTKEEKDA